MLTRRAALLAFAPTPQPTAKPLFTRGQNGVHTYRIPALLEARNHTLLAVADARQDSEDDLPGKISLVLRRSTDQGRTWSPIQTLHAVPEGGVGDPALLLDPSGRIWCFFAYGPPGIGFRTAKPGPLTGPEVLQLHAMSSDDDGHTWSAPTDLTPQLRDPSWHAFFVSSGTHFVTSNGRYILPLVVRDANQQVTARNACSDDRGITWRVSPPIAPGSDESKALEVPGGIILQNMRSAGKSRLLARSTDGGITFTPFQSNPALIDASANAGFARYRDPRHNLLLFTNAASTRRENLSIRFSRDNGLTWSPPKTIHAGPAAYSTVLQLSSGAIAVLYECGTKQYTESIAFTPLTLDWLLGTGTPTG